MDAARQPRKRVRPLIPAGRARARGLTLLELMVVLVILTIVAGIALPSAAPLAPVRLERAAGAVADALRFARDETLRTGTVHGARVERAAGRVTVFEADLGTIPLGEAAVALDPIEHRSYTFVLGDRAGTEGVMLANATDPFLFDDGTRRDTVVFDAAGAPLWIDTGTGLRSPLTDGAVDLAFAGRTERVTLDPVTARVTTQ